MKIKKLLPILAITLLVSGCGKDINTNNADSGSDASKAITSEEVQSAEESANAEPAQAEDTSELSESELDEFTALFNTPEYRGFLTDPFNSPEDVDLSAVFYYGAGIDVKDVSEDEISDYLAAVNRAEVYGDLFVFRAKDFDEFFETHLKTDAPKDLPNSYWTYVAGRDSYYYYHWSSTYDGIDFKCVSGEKVGDSYTLRFELSADKHYERFADRIIKFTKDDDNLVMESNSIMWDDNCDESQTFDIELNPSGSPIHFVTYKPDPEDGIKIVLVKDGKFMTSISTNIWRNSDYDTKLNQVTAVSFFDFNADGVKDILIIGESDMGENIILEESVPNEYYYERCYGINEKLEEELADNITVSSVKKALLGDNTECRFDNYKDAYAHIAKLYNMSSDGYVYGLIDGDGDDIPELVIDGQGYNVSLYSFDNGIVHCLMYQWAYGAGGNYGYMYAPGKNVYINHNNDYAGAVQYDSYMTSHNGMEISTDYYVESLFFKDTDGDRTPSEEELSATDEMDVFNAFYYNCTDQEMSEDEIKAKIDEFDTYQYEEVTGDVGYDDFLNVLIAS
ncbi:MAG: hypothetical protein J6I68_08540 [Butyrivibrio sp.]|uniref:hypothetical protein n=1 Tax=Butyrivibrio sp. TaxID=28121 RepID=UPI001B4D8C5D|nr:hypothetical protein [Butyrivibrio sp.]MBP3783279.1 hypothetical protein [Butyrivibrio sp.]